MAAGLVAEGIKVVTGGTDNHLLLVDVSAQETTSGNSLNGRQTESALRECGMTLNRNTIPRADKMDHAWYPSGLRVGTPAVTTLGMKQPEMSEIASIIALVIKNTVPLDSKAKYSLDEAVRDSARGRVRKLLEDFPLYPEIDVDALRELVDR